MNEQQLQELRAEVIARRNLPTIPAVLTRILHLTDAEGASGKELVDVVEHDQALTSKILRLANSAFFGQSRRVATIPRAVVLLGFSTVRNLALGVKVWDALGPGVSRANLETMWVHAVAVASAARALTARLRAGDPDEAFTAGLLHDIGRLFLATRFREQYWQAVGGPGERGAIDGDESTAFGVDHAEIGGWMLDAWSLPPGIVEAVRHHHDREGRQGVPGVLAMTDRLIAHTDLATGALAPEAGPLFETVPVRGMSVELWEQVVTDLREGGALALGALGG